MESSNNESGYIVPIRPMDVGILFCLWTGSVFGIILNSFVMVLSITDKDIKGIYVYYIFNLASLDFLSAISWFITAFYLTFYWYQSKSNTTMCYFQMLGQDFSVTVSILAMVPMSVHRRLAIDFSKKHWFQVIFNKAAVVCYCAIAYVYGVGMAIARYISLETYPYVHAPDHRAWCNATYIYPQIRAAQVNIELVSRYVSLAVILFLVFSSYFRVRQHIKEMSMTMTQDGLKESKSLALALLLQALATTFSHIPYAVFFVTWNYTKVFKNASALLIFYTVDVALICHISSYIVDPIMTLIIVKPYKRAAQKLWMKITGGKTQSVVFSMALSANLQRQAWNTS